MTSTGSRFDQVVSRYRDSRLTNAATAQAADADEFWKRFVLKAIDGGYFKSADEFVLFVEACLRYISFEQVVQDCAPALVIRDLAEVLAHKWACGTAPRNAPTAHEIAGLLQSEWIASGEFKLLRSASHCCDSARNEVVPGL